MSKILLHNKDAFGGFNPIDAIVPPRGAGRDPYKPGVETRASQQVCKWDH